MHRHLEAASSKYGECYGLSLTNDIGRTVLRVPVDDDYRWPTHFAKTMTKARQQDLRALMNDLREFCAGLAGMQFEEAMVALNGDTMALFIQDAFVELMIGHLVDRLNKPSLRETDREPLLRWVRLMHDFGWWYMDFASAVAPGHRAILGGSHFRLTWEVYQRTWAPTVTVTLGAGPDRSANIDLSRIDEVFRDSAVQTLCAFTWDMPGLTEAIVRERPGIVEGVVGDVAALRAELLALSDDLREVKALLLRGYRTEERVVALPDGSFATFQWDVGHRLGLVTLARQPDIFKNPLIEGSGTEFVVFGLDGVVQEAQPWVPVSEAAVRWSVGLLRALRDRLVEWWMAVERPPLEVAPETEDAFSEGEAVAVACASLIELDEEEGAEAETPELPAERHRIPAVREHSLLLLMERHFGCEVRFSKGSEVTVYRPGGKIFTLPGKRRGQHMPSFMIAAMLKRLGIPARDFVAIAGKGK